jgi:hypothetical protein
MNGQAARRIRHASEVSGIPVKQLKREYKAVPYHRRYNVPVTVGSSREQEAFFRMIKGHFVKGQPHVQA